MRFILVFLLFLPSYFLLAQNISENEVALDLARKSLDKMYNFETAASISYAQQLEKVLPGHPAATFLRFLNLYWNSEPGNESDNEKFHQYLQETLSRSERLLEIDKNNEEGIFFALAAHGYLSQYYAEEKNNLKALKEAKNAYSLMKAGFTLMDKNSEFYYTSGMYNYYREHFSEANPGFKTFMWVFASGDKEKGLKQLDKASNEALFTKTEATNYAANIYLRYEVAPSIAEKYAAKLVKLYPGNHLYRSVYCETLLSMGKYWEAIPHINHLTSLKIPYFNFMGDVYHGIQLEKQEKNFQKAKEKYNSVLERSEHIPYNIDHYKSMAYCGLGRISLLEGKKDLAKNYFKKVLSIANYPSVKKEAEEGLKKI